MTDYESLKKLAFKMPKSPGVYQMFNDAGQLIYVGKARRLNQRIKSYFRSNLNDRKTQVMMQQVADIKFIVTRTENEALLLESNLIKEFRPRYNVLFRDDKSYPYLFLSIGQPFPRLDFHRGPKKLSGRYFGPYPSAGAVRDNLALIQKLFKIRQCSDIFFAHRTRPCLQYQIKRCTAPCVNYVTEEDYQQQVQHALLFLEGNSATIIDDLVNKMQLASQQQHYEEALIYRDQIATLRKILAQQFIVGDTGNIDIIGIAMDKGCAAICVLFVRAGRLLGHRNFFPVVPTIAAPSEILEEFLPQYYLSPIREDQPLERIILALSIADKNWLQSALQQNMDSKLIITDKPRTEQFREWQQMAQNNAQQALNTHLAAKFSLAYQFEELQPTLNLPSAIQLIECFDVSHSSGEAAVASCVVFDPAGAVKSKYRRYNIRGIEPGDDYAALRQALSRHYAQLKAKDQPLPDLLIIDGGKGQLKQAIQVLEELQVSAVSILAISKGPTRKPGLEQLWFWGLNEPMKLPSDHPVLHLLQLIRDEAHRFAITGHRKQRSKSRVHSKLEEIPGVGVKRRRDLLNYFGGWQGLSQASVTEIAKVPGISVAMAQRIYDFCH